MSEVRALEKATTVVLDGRQSLDDAREKNKECERDLKKRSDDLDKQKKNFDIEVEKEAEAKFQERFVEPRKELDRRQQEIEQGRKKLEEDKANYKDELDNKYDHAVAQNKIMKFLLTAGGIFAVLLIAGSNLWWWYKCGKLEKNYALVYGWCVEYKEANENLKKSNSEILARKNELAAENDTLKKSLGSKKPSSKK